MNNDLIEVFILTYNRASMLECAIRSVLAQTVKTKLTVVDNHSTDGTVDLIARLRREGHNFDYIRRSANGGQEANYATAEKHFTYPYVMLYHDDDVLHPQYIESALRTIRLHPNVDLVTSSIREFSADDQLDQVKYGEVEYKMFENVQQFVSYVYCANVLSKTETLHYSPVIYKSAYRKGLKIRRDLYGKINDTPLVFAAVHDGKVIQMTTPLAWIRRHPGQDTKDLATGCRLEQVINVNALYKSYMATRSGSLDMYWWISGRHLRAGINFSDGTYSTIKLLRVGRGHGLFGYRSVFLMTEYLLCKVLRISFKPLHAWLWKRAAEFYEVQSILL